MGIRGTEEKYQYNYVESDYGDVGCNETGSKLLNCGLLLTVEN
jgi:hypothetical protein